LVAISFLAGFLALPVGIALGAVAGYSRPYADGIVMAIMQGLISIPFIGLFVLLGVAGWNPFDIMYLNAGLACSIPIMALITMMSFHGFVSSRDRVVVTTEGAPRGVRFIHSLPAIASWALSGLKYGMPLTVFTVFVCDFIRLTSFNSWGDAFRVAVQSSYYGSIEWGYILLPLIGSALLMGSIFLILDTIENITRTRFSRLV
jgi:ABC-type dipeptide/oligopeptide/nickel transport system permease subunit